MENKGFRWFLNTISSVDVLIRVLDTYTISSFNATGYYSTEETGVKFKKISYNCSSKDVLEGILQDTKTHNKNQKTPVAIGHTRGGRIFFTEALLHDFFSNPHHNFTYIQKCGAHCKETFNIFTAWLTLKDYSYDLSLFKRTDSNPIKVTNKIWIQRVQDIFQTINLSIEKYTNTKVKRIKLEFIKDDQGLFWVSFCHSCSLLRDFRPVVEIKSHRDLRLKEQLLHKAYALKINTPEDSEESAEENSLEKSYNDQSIMKKTGSAKMFESMNPDFLELLCRNRMKERKKNKLNLPSLMFYAEAEEITEEKETILNIIEDRLPSIRIPKTDRPARKSLWSKPIEARSFNKMASPRQSSPMIFPQTFNSVAACKTPTPFLNGFKEIIE